MAPQVIQWTTTFDITFLLLYMLVCIPLSAYVANNFTKYFVKRKFSSRQYVATFAVVFIIFPSVIIGKTIYANQIKYLDDLMNINVETFESLEINDWTTNNVEHAQELKDFLSNYEVKKINNKDIDHDVTGKDSFVIIINLNEKSFIASIYENKVNLVNNGHTYKVLNGPISMEWFHKFENNSDGID